MSVVPSSPPSIRSSLARVVRPPAAPVPVLLTMPKYGGTLAAVRSLGERGIPVTVAGHEVLAPARWSRHATRWVRCPSVGEPDKLLEWLLAFGRREPRHVLYASSDDMAFLMSAHRTELEDAFFLYQPPVEAMVRVLDKKCLLEACASVGLATAATWFPEGEDDVERITREASFPVLIKARTQVRRVRQNKGCVVRSRADLLRGYRAFLADHRYTAGLEQHFGDVYQPMIQEYLPAAAESVYSITGFVDRSGALSAARAAVKVMQRTQPVGLGLCFEAAPLDPDLAARVLALCRAIGHFGVFEVEMLRDGDRSLVIDMNPRFYGQMGFEAARGLPLAVLAYHAALGDLPALCACLDEARDATDGPAIYTHRFIFELLLLSRRLDGTMSGEDYAQWRAWVRDHHPNVTDASADARDWGPALVHAAAEVLPGLRALRRRLKNPGRREAKRFERSGEGDSRWPLVRSQEGSS